ncbi:long-chain-fatty-acid--CoA ligase [Sphingobium sp. Sx8-8]|uniref:long-chain-fatty-acid--CoA ligase n=1 Tax=Sphingobium sp. Sx8-8 TaxID=2933617 RepID=UPI001F57C9DF|nr:long-chain-fatty-acid--CoA ligase [Sphingobium sp. Sx8-8]
MTQALHRLLQQQPDSVAAVDVRETLTRRAFIDRVARIAGALRSAGLQPGDRVAMLARNSVDFYAYIFGTWWAGGVINPVNLRWNASEIAFSLEDCETHILIVESVFAHMIPSIREQAPCLSRVMVLGDVEDAGDAGDYRAWVAGADPVEDAVRRGDDLAAILYTGGTTGRPKGVMLSHNNLAASMLGSMLALRALERSQYLQTAPLFHIGGMSGMLAGLYTGATHVFLPAFDASAVLTAIDRHRIQELFLVPSMLRMVVDHPDFQSFDVRSVRRIRYGASPIDGGLMDRAIAAFPNAGFVQAYGMTELSPVATMLTEDDHGEAGRASGRLRSAGKAIPTAELRIVDPEGLEVPRGMVGEIAVRGPGVMLGYWNRPDATREAVRDGWMHTGDLGSMDADGYVTVVDRLKDMIITGGENVYSAEVETALSTHPAVGQAAVIAMPDEKWGERVHAVIVLRPGCSADPEALTAHCRATIAGFKVPRSYAFVDTLPLSGAGKVLKNILRDQCRAGN